MLNRVYSIFDKRIRPLRNHVYLAFPKHKIAYARIAEPAFQMLRPVLHRLAGTEPLLPESDAVSNKMAGTERLLFHGDVELLTARELRKRYPDMKVAAWVQDPLHRLAYCYDKIIVQSEELPAYYNERHFSKAMTVREFVGQVAAISDLEADNLFRSQSASLTYKGMLTADLVLQVEDFERSLAKFLSQGALNIRPLPAATYRLSNFVTQTTLLAFGDTTLVQKLRQRYRNDYDLFYSNEALIA